MNLRVDSIEHFMTGLVKRNHGQTEFHQAVREVAESVIPFIQKNPKYDKAQILERLTEPDRVIAFRVCWTDDEGNLRTNRGYRVQFNNAIGPYKGGLRFHPSVNEGILKFLGFEQIFKNSLTTLPIGGGKGGSDFNPKGKSDAEVMRFCQAFMLELSKYIGPNTDVPAGDIGVGAREISYLFGQYKKITTQFVGVLTGKMLSYGGSLIRTEATGFGSVYFMQNMLKTKDQNLEGKTCVVSGSGNVAQYTAKKLIQLGAKVLTLSDSGGFIYDPDGITQEKLEYIQLLKNEKRARISEYVKKYSSASFHAGEKPWSVSCDLVFPSATQNEISKQDAENLLKNGCMGVSEGANMPTEADAVNLFLDSGILYGPSKAANAGGVAISALEMSQNSMRIAWTTEELDERLQNIMKAIHSQCVEYGKDGSSMNYVQGANIAGFIKVADAMISQGVL